MISQKAMRIRENFPKTRSIGENDQTRGIALALFVQHISTARNGCRRGPFYVKLTSNRALGKA
jgi:hypothetical protein